MKRMAVIVRSEASSKELANSLIKSGFEVFFLPLIEISDPADGYKALDKAISEINKYDWLIFTSANAVEKFFARVKFASSLFHLPLKVNFQTPSPLMGEGWDGGDSKIEDHPLLDPPPLRGRNLIAVVGPATAKAVKRHRFDVTLIPQKYSAAGLVESFESFDVKGVKFLHVQASEGRKELAEYLRSRGADVDVVKAYQVTPIHDALAKRLPERFDSIYFFSPSGVKEFVKRYGKGHLYGKKVHGIGETTSSYIKEALIQMK